MKATMSRPSIITRAILISPFICSVLSSRPPATVQTGACYDTSKYELVQCALEAIECENTPVPTTFVPAYDVMEGECTTDNLSVGTCSPLGSCAVTEHSCEKPADYLLPRPFETCTVEGRYRDSIFVPTRYGGCEDLTNGGVTCLLDPTHCTENERWIQDVGGCRCHDVQIGMCRGTVGRADTCVISGDDCRYTDDYVPARSNEGLDCRLCPNDEAVTFGMVAAGVPDDQVEVEEEKAFDSGETVGVVLGAVTTFLFVTFGLFFMYSNETANDYLHVNPFLKQGELGTQEKPESLPHIS